MKRDKKLEFFEKQVAAGKLSNQDTDDYKKGYKQLITDDIFIRKQLGGLSGVQEFINENDVQKNCITNLSKGSIPVEKNLVIDLIGIKYGFSTTQIDPALVSYTNTTFSINDTGFDAGSTATGGEVYERLIPVVLQNAEYEIKCDGGIVDRGRVCDLLTQNVSVDGVNGHDKNFRMLEWPKLLSAGKRLECNFKFPEAASVLPPGFHYVELVLKGLGLGKRQS
jgi:hypothetical protein